MKHRVRTSGRQLEIPYSRRHTDRRRTDLFVPQRGGNGAAILWFHGGGFAGGDKDQWHPLCRHFCDLGYCCASAEYRLAPRWKFPAWVEDARLAMAWLRGRSGEYGFSADRIAAAGSSAGAYLALMLATIGPEDPLGRTEELGEAETRPRAVVTYCPASSMHEQRRWPSREAYPGLMAVPEQQDRQLYRTASVEDRIRGGEPPMLFLHGTADELIPLSESAELCAQVEQAGGQATLVRLQGAEHGFGYGVTTDSQQAAVAEVERFLKAWL